MTRSPATEAASTNVEARRFFSSETAAYDRLHYGQGARSLMTDRLHCMLQAVDSLDLPSSARALDAGCGPGRLLVELAARDFDVTGMDTSPSMLERSRVLLAERGVLRNARFQRASIEELPFADESFDLVCTAGVLEYLPNDRRAVRELARVLRPGGTLLLPITNARSPIGILDFAVEWVKRQPFLLRAINRLAVRLGAAPARARHFEVRRQNPAEIRAVLAEAGLELRDDLYFHFLPWPHPFDRLLPAWSASLGSRMERFRRSRLGPLAEGYLTVSRRTADPAADREEPSPYGA